jgi:serine/threonine protein kinase
MGEFGMVYKGAISGLGSLVAIKTSKRNIDVEQFKAMLSEIKIMSHIGVHDNIVHFVGACTANIQSGTM